MRGFCLEVSGPYACFTRPEMKVERVSYDVITPSAARAIFDAILWKPAIFWRMMKIEVLHPIRWISVRRNEVGKVASMRSEAIFIDDNNTRQQRAGLLLRDVKYRLHAEFEFIPLGKRSEVRNPVPTWLMNSEAAEDLKRPGNRADETEAKYAAMFDRRAGRGQCFTQPYLGCREFSAAFRLVDPKAEPAIWREEYKIRDLGFAECRDLGWMLYDMDFSFPSDPKPQFFHAYIENGSIDLRNVEVRS
jgi:CRISPR-associated protein Cas5d